MRPTLDKVYPALARHRHGLMIVMLALLHTALLLERESWLAHGLILAHVGMALLWQPVWRGEKMLTPFGAVSVALASLVFALWVNWWLLALWLSLLSGLIGGLVFASQRKGLRWFYLVVLLYLVGVLLIWVVPHLLPGEGVPQAARLIMFGGFPLVIAALLVMSSGDEPDSLRSIDFFYSLLFFLLMAALVLGSFVLKVETREGYLTALTMALFITALVLLGMSWAWNPRAGFAGLEQVFSRYLLSVGLPFEQWLLRLAKLSEREPEPGLFLTQAMEGMSEVPGIAGGEWTSPDGNGKFGEQRPFSALFELPPMTLTIYAKSPLGPAMLMHINLLVQLVGAFYQAKRREQMLEQQAYLQAVHETGARLTHDVKNLLQSLKGLCAATDMGHSDGCGLQSLFARQLPRITQRLEQTLEKLRQPVGPEEIRMVGISEWWDGACLRYGAEDVAFDPLIEPPVIELPSELFDSVLDNLLQNALEKRKMSRQLRITVRLDFLPAPSLWVCDDGKALTEKLATRVFRAPLQSSNGLGVGLYQAARLAERYGYALELSDNANGRVCFVLKKSVNS